AHLFDGLGTKQPDTFYIDGREIYSTTEHVPKDAADGGVNMVLGAELIYAPAHVSMVVSAMSYAAPKTTAAITSGAVSGSSKPRFAAAGDPNRTTSQTLYTSPGVDVLQGGKGGDVFFVDASSRDGWAEIDNMHAGDMAAILGFVVGRSAITWANGTDAHGEA